MLLTSVCCAGLVGPSSKYKPVHLIVQLQTMFHVRSMCVLTADMSNSCQVSVRQWTQRRHSFKGSYQYCISLNVHRNNQIPQRVFSLGMPDNDYLMSVPNIHSSHLDIWTTPLISSFSSLSCSSCKQEFRDLTYLGKCYKYLGFITLAYRTNRK